MATQMAATRQPFAPLNSSRLQNLTSLKNRQNALSTLTSPVKRKAHTISNETTNSDSENIDPSLFLSPNKRSKCPDGHPKETFTFTKPINYFFTPAPPSPPTHDTNMMNPILSPTRPIRSPTPRLQTSTMKNTPLSAPAGRSPTRKRIGILNRRKSGSGSFTRIDPPKFSTSSPAPTLGFSIDAALSSTLSSSARARQSSAPMPTPTAAPTVSNMADLNIPELYTAPSRPSWFFEIHEDTEEELATNLMEHGACTLDISSDEECAARERDARGKENVPPMDDISQTRTQLNPVEMAEGNMEGLKARVKARRGRAAFAEGEIEVDREPLGDLKAEDFYAEGCDGSEVFVIPADEAEEHDSAHQSTDFGGLIHEDSSVMDVKGKEKEVDFEVVVESLVAEGNLEEEVKELMQKDDYEMGRKAAVLEPLEKAEEGFEVWESGSAKGDE